MPDDDALERTIRKTAQSAKRAKGDNGELEQHSLTAMGSRLFNSAELRDTTSTQRFPVSNRV